MVAATPRYVLSDCVNTVEDANQNELDIITYNGSYNVTQNQSDGPFDLSFEDFNANMTVNNESVSSLINGLVTANMINSVISITLDLDIVLNNTESYSLVTNADSPITVTGVDNSDTPTSLNGMVVLKKSSSTVATCNFTDFDPSTAGFGDYESACH